MAKKSELPGAAASAAVRDKKETEARPREQSGGCASGFYCYIGPSIAGLIQNGSIYRGGREDALKAIAGAVEKCPLVKTLLVSGDALSEARLKVKQPGNALYANYKKIAAAMRR